MITIWKFDLPIKDRPKISMPKDASIIYVGAQDNKAKVWALVDTDNNTEIREFIVHGTGHPIEEDNSYLGSVMLDNGALVWHIFEEW